MKENLGIDKSSINDEDRAAELDAMDAEVAEIMKNNGVENKEMYDNEKRLVKTNLSSTH